MTNVANVRLGGGLGTSIAVGMIPKFVEFQKFEIIVIIWLAFSAVADCAITIALVWHLVSLPPLHDNTLTERLFNSVGTRRASLLPMILSTELFAVSRRRLQRTLYVADSYPVTVQTGLITALCALIDLVLFLATVCRYSKIPLHCSSRNPAAHRSPSRLQPPPFQALHELSDVELELPFWMEVRKRQRRHYE